MDEGKLDTISPVDAGGDRDVVHPESAVGNFGGAVALELDFGAAGADGGDVEGGLSRGRDRNEKSETAKENAQKDSFGT